jgi:hypothetical protein
MGQKGDVSAWPMGAQNAVFRAPISLVSVTAHYLCAAQDLSESQILDADAYSCRSLRQAVNHLK